MRVADVFIRLTQGAHPFVRRPSEGASVAFAHDHIPVARNGARLALSAFQCAQSLNRPEASQRTAW